MFGLFMYLNRFLFFSFLNLDLLLQLLIRRASLGSLVMLKSWIDNDLTLIVLSSQIIATLSVTHIQIKSILLSYI